MKNQLQRKTTVQVATSLATNIVDQDTVQRYGTSVDENMTREHQKKLREKYHKLKEEFLNIDKDSNSFVSYEELIQFFNNREKEGKVFDRKYLAKVFDLMDRDKDDQLTVNEFVEAYMEIEERIRVNHLKFSLLIEDQKRVIERYEKKLKESEDEEYYPNGLSKKSVFNITLFEAKELAPGWLGSLDSYAILTMENQTKQTKLEISNLNPAWNEDFVFEVTNTNSILKITLHSKQTLGITNVLGFAEIELQSLMDQQKTDKWYNLILGDKTTGNGRIRLRLQFIYSKRKYFTDAIQTTISKIRILERKRNILNEYIKNIDEPFGVIQLGNINDNLKNIIYNEDEIAKEIESNRKSVYAMRTSNMDNGVFFNTLNTIIGGDSRKEIQWGSLVKIMMYTSIALSLIVLLERSDFVNLLISIAIWVLFVYDKSNDIENYLMPLIITIGVSLGYDLLWLIIKFGSFVRGPITDYELGIKKWVYFFSSLNFIVKIVLIITLWLLKNKKIKAKEGSA